MGDDGPRARAAAALRRMGHALMAHEAGDDLLDRIAEAADAVTRDLERAPPRRRDLVAMKRTLFELDVPDGAPVSHFDGCFVSGSENPLGVAIRVRREGDEAVADVEFGPAFEGPPERAHGGIIAAVFDDVLGYLLVFLHEPAFTGELVVRYLAPTPLRVPLEFRGRVVGRENRRILTAGEARSGDEVLAQATATFVTVDPDRIRA